MVARQNQRYCLSYKNPRLNQYRISNNSNSKIIGQMLSHDCMNLLKQAKIKRLIHKGVYSMISMVISSKTCKIKRVQ